jgi:hypothetical protein
VAELTNLEAKLAEVLGLAMAAQGATDKVKSMLADDDDLASMLQRMHDEAAETEERCTTLAGEFEGKKTAILDSARETKQEANGRGSSRPGRGRLGGRRDRLDEVAHLVLVDCLGEIRLTHDPD